MLGAVKNNPAFQSDEELISGFVVRRRAFNQALETLRSALDGNHRHHLLLLGRRGMGKTTLGLRLAAEIRRDPGLRRVAVPVAFPEENYEIGSIGEFALCALTHLAEQQGDRELAELAACLDDTCSDPLRLNRLALEAIGAWAEQRAVTLVLFIENLDMLLDEQLGRDAARELAGVLDRCPWMHLVASAVSGIPAMERPSEPLFDRFEVIRLSPLGVAECRRLWNSLTGAEATAQQVHGDRIRPIHILTGGSPRLLKIIGASAPGRTLADLMDELLLFVDEHTSYFKSVLESLPPTERKVFTALADLWAPATARQVAKRARLDVNRTSSLLHRLAGRGAAEVTRIDGRTKTYQVADRSYNLYHLLRRGGPSAKRLRALVRFMVQFYRGEVVRELPQPDSDVRQLDTVLAAAAAGNWELALTVLPAALAWTDAGEARAVADVTELMATGAAHGHVAELLEALANAPEWRIAVEPMHVALTWLADEDADVCCPTEVHAVALDLLSTISARRG